MGNYVSFNKLVLLHKILDWCQILANLICGQDALNLTKPEIKILHCSNECSLSVCFLQLHWLLTCLLCEQLPLLSNRLKSILNSFFAPTAFLPVNEVLTHSKYRLDPVSISSQLCLKCLVLLVFWLNVCWILVVLFLGKLKFLKHPGFNFISISGELLESLGFPKLCSLFNQSFFELLPSFQNIFLLLVDVWASIMLRLNELVSICLKRLYFLLLVSNGFIEVFMFLDHGFDIVFLAVNIVISLQESFSWGHPVFCLLTISVEQLQFKALVKLHPSCNPCLFKILPGIIHTFKLFLNFRSSEVISLKQLLSKELKSLESSGASINFCPVFLVPLKESFSSSHIICKFISTDETFHAADPGHQVPVVTQEALKVVWIQKLNLAKIGFCTQVSPFFIYIFLLFIDNLCIIFVGMHKLACFLIKLVDLVSKSSEISLKTFVFALKCLDCSEVLANIIIIQGFILLPNPIFGFIHIPVEHLNLVGFFKSCSLLSGHLL